MVPSPRLKKPLAWLCLALYLLLGSGGAHAFVWCHDSSGDSRVEFNLAGRCAPGCGDEASAPVVEPRSLQEETGNDCIDQSTSLQHFSFRNFDPGLDLPLLVGSMLPAAQFPHPTLTQVRLLRAPQPPPSQALATLRITLLLI